jgi:DNA-binding transcriptional MerR regulator
LNLYRGGVATYTVGQIAERSGFSASTLRYYEDIGLLTPTSRTAAGYRLYDDHALERLAFVVRAKQLGCSLDEIGDLLGVWDGERCGPVQRRLHQLVTDKLTAAHGQIGELIGFAVQLQEAAARLESPPIDNPCGPQCACLADQPDESTPLPVTLSVGASIACALQPHAVPDRVEAWQALLTHARARVRTAKGCLRIEFHRDVDIAELARLAAAEQHCCAFFAFTMTIDERGLALEVGAPERAAEVVTAMFGTAASETAASSALPHSPAASFRSSAYAAAPPRDSATSAWV